MGSPKETVENFHATYWQMIPVLISTSLVWNACHLVPGKILEHINCLCERRSCHLVANDCTCKWKIRKRACLIICSRAGRVDDTILLLHLLSKSVPHPVQLFPCNYFERAVWYPRVDRPFKERFQQHSAEDCTALFPFLQGVSDGFKIKWKCF